MALGDINNNSITKNIFGVQQRTSLVLDHIERLQREIENHVVSSDVLEELEYYTKPRPAKQSLQGKLETANRSDEITAAIELKEVFAKQVIKFQLHSSAQHLFALCLGIAHAYFDAHVRPAITAGADRATIDHLITERVVLEVAEKMELWVTPQAVRGALYTLAANCHISWHLE